MLRQQVLTVASKKKEKMRTKYTKRTKYKQQ